MRSVFIYINKNTNLGAGHATHVILAEDKLHKM